MGPAEAQQPARNLGPKHGVPPLTRGFPMSADFVEEMEDRIQGTKEIQRGRFVRDSEGRTHATTESLRKSLRWSSGLS